MKSAIVGVCDCIHSNSEHQPYEEFACWVHVGDSCICNSADDAYERHACSHSIWQQSSQQWTWIIWGFCLLLKHVTAVIATTDMNHIRFCLLLKHVTAVIATADMGLIRVSPVTEACDSRHRNNRHGPYEGSACCWSMWQQSLQQWTWALQGVCLSLKHVTWKHVIWGACLLTLRARTGLLAEQVSPAGSPSRMARSPRLCPFFSRLLLRLPIRRDDASTTPAIINK